MRGLDASNTDPEVALVVPSVLPVFSHESDRPESIGTCVLARIDDQPFAITAAHVIHELTDTTGRFTVAVGGDLISLHADRFVTDRDDPTDVGLVPLVPSVFRDFTERGAVVLGPEMIDESERGDGTM